MVTVNNHSCDSSHIVVGLHHMADDFISDAVTWFSHGLFSHIALLSPDGSEVIEASGFGKPSGVRVMSIEVWGSKHPDYVLRKIPHPNPTGVWDAACSQLGKGYDWLYLLGWLLRRNWHDISKWVCSELIEWACRQAGHSVFPDNVSPMSVTPQSFYLISQPAN